MIGALILGTGMSLAMTDLAGTLGATAMVPDIAVGLVGIVLVALAWTVCLRRLKEARGRIAPEALRLSDELMK